jgi:hypothetical protein
VLINDDKKEQQEVDTASAQAALSKIGAAPLYSDNI